MTKENRKAIIAAYRERKVEAGVYVVRCMASDLIWVGAATDLSAIRNRLWFMLRQGTHPEPGLQAAWTRHGEEAFGLATAVRLDADMPGYMRDTSLRALVKEWAETLRAACL